MFVLGKCINKKSFIQGHCIIVFVVLQGWINKEQQ